MKIFERNISRLRLLLFSSEFVLMLGMLYAIDYAQFLLRNGLDLYWSFDYVGCLGKCIVFVSVCQASMYLNELYDYKVTRGQRELAIRLLQSLGISFILLGVLYLLNDDVRLPQTSFLIAVPSFIVFLWRRLYGYLTRAQGLSERVVVLGSSKAADMIIEEIAEVKDSGFEIRAVFIENGEAATSQSQSPATRSLVPADRVFPRGSIPWKRTASWWP